MVVLLALLDLELLREKFCVRYLELGGVACLLILERVGLVLSASLLTLLKDLYRLEIL